MIYIQQPTPNGEKIMQVIMQEKKKEERYNSATGSLTNFRLLVIDELLKKIKEAR